MAGGEPRRAEDRRELDVSKTMFQPRITITVNDSCDRPDGVSEDAVVDEVCEVAQKALDEWYATRGQALLACEPLVL